MWYYIEASSRVLEGGPKGRRIRELVSQHVRMREAAGGAGLTSFCYHPGQAFCLSVISGRNRPSCLEEALGQSSECASSFPGPTCP